MKYYIDQFNFVSQPCTCISLFFKRKGLFYLLKSQSHRGRGKERDSKIFHFLVYSSDGSNSLGLLRPKKWANRFSPLGGRGQSTWVTCFMAFPRPWAGSRIWSATAKIWCQHLKCWHYSLHPQNAHAVKKIFLYQKCVQFQLVNCKHNCQDLT